MAVSSSLRRRLRLAIGSAFVNYSQLAMVVGEGDWPNLENVQLEKIARPDELNIVIHNLVSWAERTGHLKRLFSICLAENSNNPALRALIPEMDQLTEQPALQVNDIAIDDTSYPDPPPVLSKPQRTLFKINVLAIAAMMLLISIWSSIFIEQAFWVIFPGILSGIASIIWVMISEKEKALRIQAITSRWLASSRTTQTMVATLCMGLGGSLFVSKVQYVSFANAPEIQVLGRALSPGNSRWLLTYPWGRTITPQKIPIGFSANAKTIRPWAAANIRLEIWPSVVIVPNKRIMAAISTQEDDPARIWTLEITLSRANGTNSYPVQAIKPYTGGPVIVTKNKQYIDDLSKFNLNDFAGYSVTLRPKTYCDIELFPGDILDIKLSRGNVEHLVRKLVTTPQSHSDIQKVKLPE